MAHQHHQNIVKVSFSQLLQKFPEVELPVSLTDETLQEFSKNNQPLPFPMIVQFLDAELNETDNEFTEYVACCRLPETHDFHALIYWKAELMNYEYILVTFDKKGKPIDKKIIAGTKLDNELLVRSVATIDVDWIIYIVGGIADKNGDNFDASSSQSLQLELLATGEIITHVERTTE